MDKETKKYLIVGAIIVVICIVCLLCSSSLGLFKPKPVQICLPGTTQICPCSDGKGVQLCKADGSGYGSCENCKPEQICKPGSEKECATKCPNGSPQIQTCNPNGLSYSPCACKGTLCNPGAQNVCQCSDGKSGTQTCNSDGSAYNPCDCTPPKICNPGDKRTCTCPNGSGTETCNSDGTAYNPCDCPPPKICTPGQQQDCSCEGGKKGKQTCNIDGTAYNACDCTPPKICTPGDKRTCTCSSGSGFQICNSDGTAYSTCDCTPPKICTPGQQQDCTCGAGRNGKQTCNADGTAYNPCECAPDMPNKLYAIGRNDGSLYGKSDPNGDWVPIQTYKKGEPKITSFSRDSLGNYIGTFDMTGTDTGLPGTNYTFTKQNIYSSWNGPREPLIGPRKYIAGNNNDYYALGRDNCIYYSKCLTGPWNKLENSCGMQNIILDKDGKRFVGVGLEGKIYTKASASPNDKWILTNDDCCASSIALVNDIFYGIGLAPKTDGIYQRKNITDPWSAQSLNNSRGFSYINGIKE
ncbi:MAG: hypothetical protein Edafosvirus4_42 [Edafosvirus sp.]|uniref:Uncharacterized protein n=1 Tax=Edafosvirus sp. TaxID=2487765 RepID=A0A3G4ZT42_9VIRU|nr:MAG: hypothetical protein Edafosvirus4_42 [Edafosvirus sp.]